MMEKHRGEIVDEWLVVWLRFGLFSQKSWEFLIIPIDELIFFRGVAQPPTSGEWLMNG